MRNILRGATLGIAIALVPASALASGKPVKATVSVLPGGLTFSPSPDLTVIDATGSGEGWQVLASVTGGTATATVSQEACGTGSTCTLPLSNIGSRTVVQPGQAPAPIVQALPGSGMGTILAHVSWHADSNIIISLQLVSGP